MIELYDLVGANDVRLSPFCARAKAVLCYKNLAYSTTTVRFNGKAEDCLFWPGSGPGNQKG